MAGRVGRALVLPLATVVAACGGERARSGPSAAEDFCASVLPKVETYLTRASREREPPPDPRFGGRVTVGSIAELPAGMNAFTSPDYAATQHQQHVLLSTLLRYGADLELRPYLAESWDVDPDGREIVFHLRRDVSWHDGTPTTARDVAFTYRRITDPRTGFPNPALLASYVPGETGVEVLDDHTVKVRLEPHADFLAVWTTVSVMPAHLLEAVPPEELATHPYGTVCPVGNGPFAFREHRPQDRWIFEANPSFPEALGGRPLLDRYVYRVIADETTLLTELLTGGIDVYISPTPDQAKRIEDEPSVELRRYPFRNVVFVAWNSRRPALADARVRRAITMATPRRELVDALAGGYGVVANGRIPPFHPAYRPTPDGTLRHDPARARALLEEGGWSDRDGDGVREGPDGTRLSLTIQYNTGNAQRARIAEIMQARLSDVGIEVRPEAVEWGTLLGRITDPDVRDLDGVVMAFVTDFRIDDTDLFHSERADGPYAWSGTRNPELDHLLERLGRTVDRGEALRLWGEYERALNEEQPYTFLYFPDRLDGVSSRLRGVEMDARGEWINAGEWWIDPAHR